MRAIRSFLIGNLSITSDGEAIVEIKATDEAANNVSCPVIERCVIELNDYFLGQKKTFTFPIKYKTGTKFQQAVWNALRDIPFGTTISYKTLAKRVRTENHTRAVANANGKNPILIAIPCHRVIESSGKLGGFSAGLDVKRMLLNIENLHLQK